MHRPRCSRLLQPKKIVLSEDKTKEAQMRMKTIT